MTVKKLQRFAELSTFPNAFQHWVDLKGKWNSDYFKNPNPITLELACGKAEYTIALAQEYPNRNFIGVDLKGARLWRGAKTALEQNLNNTAFLRTPIERIDEFFSIGEVAEMWIPFPDPFPRKGKAKKRLTSPRFLNLYRAILRRGGLIHLKTDDEGLFNYTLETLKSENCCTRQIIPDLYGLPEPDVLLITQTAYERKHLQSGKKIKYLCFSLG
ncbi:MAG: tRNA (guanosine(46)-N7)-methyltransferase TrmB [candidate division Zixibacteria bacterium RBG_16_50_21]|nr:MAG: tRNA (guanosine(46)-N7)-methyltransferase TrmB [candidate division Zixibacteria bacterium RBG_16_50_21]